MDIELLRRSVLKIQSILLALPADLNAGCSVMEIVDLRLALNALVAAVDPRSAIRMFTDDIEVDLLTSVLAYSPRNHHKDRVVRNCDLVLQTLEFLKATAKQDSPEALGDESKSCERVSPDELNTL